MLEIARAQPGALRQDARRGDEPRCPPACRSWPCAGRSRNEPASPELRRRRERRRARRSAPARRRSRRRGKSLGEAAPGRLVKDRRDLDYLRVFASARRWWAGRSAISSCRARRRSIVVQVRRGDTDILPRPDLVLEFGDRVGLLAHRGDFRGDAQVLRRLDQGHRRVQLHLDRPRHGARLPGRRDPDSAARHRQDRASGCRAC